MISISGEKRKETIINNNLLNLEEHQKQGRN